jgi:hypothetical protein
MMRHFVGVGPGSRAAVKIAAGARNRARKHAAAVAAYRSNGTAMQAPKKKS